MRILFVSPRYYPHVGGVEYVVKSVAEGLAKAGHEVVVLAGEPKAEKPAEEVVNGVRVVKWPVWSPGEAYHIPKMWSRLEDWLVREVKGFDVVHVHSVHSVFSVSVLRGLSRLDSFVVLTPYYHGTGHTLPRRLLWLYWRKYVRNLVKRCGVVHTVSRLEAELVRRDFGVDAVVIENGVEGWIKGVKWDPSNYVMYSGRIERYKNIDLLARITKLLNTEYGVDLELKVFGEGPYKTRLKKILDTLGVRYEIEGFQPFEKYIQLLSHASLYGLLSQKESYPQSINEANAIGVPTLIAKPWGINFQGRSRTLIIDVNDNIRSITKMVYEFLERAPKEQRSNVPTWDDVVNTYIAKLYMRPYHG
jgi:glycosyltransferase involved in cell wall biosynthesis